MDPITFFRVIGALFGGYFHHAWPFCIGHALIAAAVITRVREIRSEAQDLSIWSVGMPGSKHCSRILALFVKEAQTSGERGIVTPMTDFSDRLDARIQELESGLHGSINFFVVVGIAGTFFALFQFAYQTGSTATVAAVSELLRSSLSNAFPVGFVGLLWTVLAYFFCQQQVDRLRRVAATATESALSARADHMTSPALQLQHALHQELEPLRQFDVTLGEKLEPVMLAFRDQLAASGELLQQQVLPLSQAADGIRESHQAMAGVLNNLAGAAGRLPETLSSIADLHQRTADATESMRIELAGASESVKQAAVLLASASYEVSQSGARLQSIATEQIGTIGTAIAAAGEAQARLIAGKLEPLREGIASASGNIRESAELMASTPGRLVQEHTAFLRTVLETLKSQWQSSLQQSLAELENQQLNALDRIKSAANEAAEGLQQASAQMRSLGGNAEQSLRQFADSLLLQVREQLAPALTALSNSANVSLPAVSDHLDQAAISAREIETATRAAVEDLKAAGGAFKLSADHLEKTLDEAKRGDAQRSNWWAGILPELNQLTAHLRALNQQIEVRSSRSPWQFWLWGR